MELKGPLVALPLVTGEESQRGPGWGWPRGLREARAWSSCCLSSQNNLFIKKIKCQFPDQSKKEKKRKMRRGEQSSGKPVSHAPQREGASSE